MRVAYYVHGRGRGHASRALTVVPALRGDGHDVDVFASGDAVGVLRNLGGVREVHGVRPGLDAPLRIARRTVSDLLALQGVRPDAVITDGDPGGAAAGRLGRWPTISIGHGLVYTHCRLPDGLGLLDPLVERVNVASADAWAHRHVPVHFLPIEAAHAGVTVARPDRRPDLPLRPEEDDEDPFLLAYFRDGNGADMLDALTRRGHRVVCFGRQERMPRSAEVRPQDRREFAWHLARCRAVVCSAGSNLLAEAILLGRPLLALYKEGDREQRMNARLLEASGAGQSARFPAPPARDLDRFLGRVDGGEFSPVDLERELPPVSMVVVALVRELAAGAAARV